MRTGPNSAHGQFAGPVAERTQIATRRRVEAIDIARGMALAAMAVYHFSWDLSFYGLADIPVTSATGWIVFARVDPEARRQLLECVGLGGRVPVQDVQQ